MRKLLMAVLCASLFLVGAASADVVAVKTSSGLTFQIGTGTLDNITDARFQSPNPVTVVTTNVADSQFYNAGNSRWQNQGASTQFGGPDGEYGKWALYKFDLAAVAGFAGGTVDKAEFRLHADGGSLTIGALGPIVSSDWDEGNKTGQYGDYPGKTPSAPGVSFAHPSGVNTTSLRNPQDGTTAPLQTWGDGNDFFNVDPTTSATYAPDDSQHPGDGDSSMAASGTQVRPSANGYEGWVVYDVTDIVTAWADGTMPNYGLYLARSPRLDTSESGWEKEPVLFVEFEPGAAPVSEPGAFGLLLMGLPALRRRRR